MHLLLYSSTVEMLQKRWPVVLRPSMRRWKSAFTMVRSQRIFAEKWKIGYRMEISTLWSARAVWNWESMSGRFATCIRFNLHVRLTDFYSAWEELNTSSVARAEVTWSHGNMTTSPRLLSLPVEPSQVRSKVFVGAQCLEWSRRIKW